MKKLIIILLTLSLAACTFHAEKVDFTFTPPRDYTNPIPVLFSK